MEKSMQDSVPTLVSYLISLADINPSWHCKNDVNEKPHLNTFSNLLGHEYSTTKNFEIQRSNNPEKSLFHEMSNPTACGSLKIEYSPAFGRYLVASRDIDAGDVVFREKPLVLAPKAGTGPTCMRCLKFIEDAWEGCDGCGAPVCSSMCPADGHSAEECKIVSRLGLKEKKDISLVKMLNVLLTPLRTLLLMENDVAVAEILAALQSNKEVRRNLHIGHYIEEHIVATLQKSLEIDVKSDVVHHICGVFDTNAFEISVDDCSRGRALFPLGAIMNHSCLPNTQHWFRDGLLIVRAVKDIMAGESITNTYTPMLLGTRARAAHLAATKLFRCACKRCIDPMELGSHVSSISCRSCKNNEGFMVPPEDNLNEWRCRECGNRMPGVAVDTMIRAASSTRSRVPLHDLEALRITSDHLKMMLGKRHYITLEIRYALLNAIMKQPLRDIKDEDLNTAVEISGQLLEMASFIDPGFSRFRGLLLLSRIQASTEQLMRNCDKGSLCNGILHKPEVGKIKKEEDKEKETIEMHEMTPRQKAQMLLREAAECEFILQYDPKMEEALTATNRLRSFLNDS
ncbi:SET and MYND domain-containing protein 4-like [Palaemon carinicauda]|uniref:SET and MYND domain-containing protein 4-like n=1 Tax=Palaemon carinicauda TaxID=392227 RepID=UPI0035B576F4